MAWNFRLVKHTEPKTKRTWYGVHEVFYNDAGRPWAMTEEPVQVDGESAKDVAAYLKMIQRDLKRLLVIDADTIKWAKPPRGIRGGRTREFKSVKDLVFAAELAHRRPLEPLQDDERLRAGIPLARITSIRKKF